MKKAKISRDDIARIAEVSPSTVSRALTDSPLLPAATIERIKKIAAEHGYYPSQLARRFSENRSRNIAFAVPHNLSGGRRGAFSLTYFSGILDALVLRAGEFGYRINILPYQPDGENTASLLAGQWQDKSVDALVLSGLLRSSRIPGELLKLKVPFVLVGTVREDCNCVNFDHGPAIRRMVEILELKNCRKVFFVSGDMLYDDAVRQRRQLLDSIKCSSIRNILEIPGDYSRRCGYRVAPEIINDYEKGDAIIMANDRMASGFYRYCWEHSLSVADFLIAGFDDVPEARVLYPELTTIRERQSELGAAAIDILLEMLAGKSVRQQLLIESEFVRRKSL